MRLGESKQLQRLIEKLQQASGRNVTLVTETLKIAKQQYLDKGLVDQKTFDALAVIDPSQTKKYLPWIIKQYLNSEYPKIRIDDLRNTIEEYHALLSRNILDRDISKEDAEQAGFTKQDLEELEKTGGLKRRKDINAFKTFDELQALVGKLNKIKTKGAIKLELKKDAEVVLNNSDLYIVVPLTHEASCVYGAGTKWCTTAHTNTHWDSYYYRDNVTFYYTVVKSDKLKAILRDPKVIQSIYGRKEGPNKESDMWKVAIVVFASGGRIDAYDAHDDSIDAKAYIKAIGLKM